MGAEKSEQEQPASSHSIVRQVSLLRLKKYVLSMHFCERNLTRDMFSNTGPRRYPHDLLCRCRVQHPHQDLPGYINKECPEIFFTPSFFPKAAISDRSSDREDEKNFHKFFEAASVSVFIP